MHLFSRRLIECAWFFTSLLVHHIAQNTLLVSAFSPPIVFDTQYATMNDTLYVQGGYDKTSQLPIGDFFSLSLSQPWNDTAPPWESLSTIAPLGNPPTYVANGALAVTPDNNNLVLWVPNLFNLTWLYHPKNNSWTTMKYTVPITLGLNEGGKAVIDPESSFDWNIYAPSGCELVNGTHFTMVEYSVKYDVFNGVSMPYGPIPTEILGYSFAYCTLRMSIMLYGGRGELASAINPYLFEYSPKGGAWTFLTPLGGSPGDLSNHCMVETTDGSRMILFGGVNALSQYSSRLFFLNLANISWTEGADAGAINARAGHVCSTNGDSFVVWGGQNGTDEPVKDQRPLIYNIPTNQWVHNFVISGPLPGTATTVTSITAATTSVTAESTSTNLASPPVTPKFSSMGGIIGGTIGGLAVIGIAGIFLLRRQKRVKSSLPTPSKKSGQGILGNIGGYFGKGATDGDGYDDIQYHGGDGIFLQDTSRRGASGTPYHSSASSTPSMDQLAHEGNSYPRSIRHPQDLTFRSHHASVSSKGYDSPFGTREVRAVSEQGITNPPQYPALSNISGSPLPSMLPSQTMFAAPSSVSVSRSGNLQGGVPTLEPFQHFGHYSMDSDRLLTTRTRPDGASIGPSHGHGPQLFVPGESNRYDVWSEGDWSEPRNPQRLGSVYGTSPADWMRKINTASSMNDTPLSNRIVSESGSYFSPPPGQQQAQTESDLMEMKLRLMKAQHELELERVRLEQKAQMQLTKKRLLHIG